MPCQQAAQIGQRQKGCIDHMVRRLADGLQQLALDGDAIHDRAVERERMAAARFIKAALQRFVIAI